MELTIKQWFNRIKNSTIRAKALKNLDKKHENSKRSAITNALLSGFSWGSTPEKRQYWSNIHKDFIDGKRELNPYEHNGFKVGDIIVTTSNLKYSRKKGDIFEVIRFCDSMPPSMYYKPSSSSKLYSEFRHATPNEIDAYNAGIENINDIIKPTKSTKIWLDEKGRECWAYKMQPGDVRNENHPVIKYLNYSYPFGDAYTGMNEVYGNFTRQKSDRFNRYCGNGSLVHNDQIPYITLEEFHQMTDNKYRTEDSLDSLPKSWCVLVDKTGTANHPVVKYLNDTYHGGRLHWNGTGTYYGVNSISKDFANYTSLGKVLPLDEFCKLAGVENTTKSKEISKEISEDWCYYMGKSRRTRKNHPLIVYLNKKYASNLAGTYAYYGEKDGKQNWSPYPWGREVTESELNLIINNKSITNLNTKQNGNKETKSIKVCGSNISIRRTNRERGVRVKGAGIKIRIRS